MGIFVESISAIIFPYFNIYLFLKTLFWSLICSRLKSILYLTVFIQLCAKVVELNRCQEHFKTSENRCEQNKDESCGPELLYLKHCFLLGNGSFMIIAQKCQSFRRCNNDFYTGPSNMQPLRSSDDLAKNAISLTKWYILLGEPAGWSQSISILEEGRHKIGNIAHISWWKW